LAHLDADRGLTQAYPLASGRETAPVKKGGKRAELTEIHADDLYHQKNEII